MGSKYSNGICTLISTLVAAGLGIVFSPQRMVAQTGTIKPEILVEHPSAGIVHVLDLGRHYVTSIRLPEAVTSIAVGDPSLFKVELVEQEPLLLFIKPLTADPAESNLLVSTASGRTFCFLLRSSGLPAGKELGPGPAEVRPTWDGRKRRKNRSPRPTARTGL